MPTGSTIANMENTVITKKRCISAYVENQIGVLAKISGLFAGKNYNLDTLTVGETEDSTMSRMTIELTCDDLTFEQIIKQLNRSVEVIKVIDFTDMPITKKELLFIKVNSCKEGDKQEIFRIAKTFDLKVVDYNKKAKRLKIKLLIIRNLRAIIAKEKVKTINFCWFLLVKFLFYQSYVSP